MNKILSNRLSNRFSKYRIAGVNLVGLIVSSALGAFLLAVIVRVSFTVSNNYTASASYKAYIYDADDVTVGAVSPMKIVVRDRFDSSPALVNQVIPAGGSLKVESSALDALYFTVTGRSVDS